MAFCCARNRQQLVGSRVTIHLDNLELVGIDSVKAIGLVNANIVPWLREAQLSPAVLLNLTYQANQDPVHRICTGHDPIDPGRRSVIHVVNRVLYAHSIQYEYSRSSDAAGRLALDIAQSAATKTLVPAAGTAPPTVGVPATASASADAAAQAAAAQLQALSAAVAANAPTAPGVRATVGVGNYGNAALTLNYPQPMAVGFVSASSFTVRGSLILSGRNEAESEQQLKAVEQFCADNFKDAAALGMSWDTFLSPVGAITCSNTSGLLDQSDLHSAHGCEIYHKAVGNGALEPSTQQDRDGKAHSSI